MTAKLHPTRIDLPDSARKSVVALLAQQMPDKELARQAKEAQDNAVRTVGKFYNCIAGYVGRYPIPKSWTDAARAIKELTRRDFPNLTDAQAESFARQLFNEKDGRPAAGYDPQLSKCLSVLDGPMPQLWPQFEALKRVPVLVIRGENSDLLSEKTVEDMRRRHPMLASVSVPGEGHAPLLWDEPTTKSIAQFFAETDSVGHSASVKAA